MRILHADDRLSRNCSLTCGWCAFSQAQSRQPLRIETFSVAAPAPQAAVCQVAVRNDRLALLWSDGTLHVCRLSVVCSRRHTAPREPGPEVINLPFKGFAIGIAPVTHHSLPCLKPTLHRLHVYERTILYYV